MTLQLRKRLISIKEYHQMAEAGILNHRDKLELIQGEILHMSPIGSKHQATVDKLTRLFNRLLVEDEAIVRAQGPIQIKDWSEPEPDLMLLKFRSDFYENQHPQPKDTLLLIEVADSSYDYDKETKCTLYAQAKIKEYWIVNLHAKQIEIHLSPKDGIYKKILIAKSADVISCSSFPSHSIPVKKIL
jgi:Uma2 family endonuclease